MLRNNLLEVQGQMSNAQKARFNMIRQRFESRFTTTPNIKAKSASSQTAPPRTIRKKKTELEAPPDSTSRIIRTYISPLGNIPTNIVATEAEISSPSVELTSYSPCPHYLAPKHKVKYMVGLQGAIYPLRSFGLMAGFLKDTERTIRLGGYVKCLSDFKFKGITPSYFCNSDGIMPDGRKVWADGETTSRRFSAAAGVLMGFGRYCGCHLGVGYASSQHYIKDISGNWVNTTDISANGFALEIGAIFFMGKHLWAGVGLSSTAFRYFEPQLSFGFKL